ncbi:MULTISPECIES: sodium:solute symporter family protein [Leeuwenhoekiella]|jgi:Na+/proline symporter|uniref:sodium:solute symporter family protein n=1 Tax=Leeuwenhoekiella TaxID=283735 RepID=UPI000E9DA0F8|nr:sodium:solute symporter family protein [Leeuwenhoekiella blandensis]HBT08565.1 Na+:solute symporter [Leeuwenhoekiella sp.]|tara:strand:- start:123788 stop:125608 length:1821 start_codon:yes stop_codon:yes gene_type:complete
MVALETLDYAIIIGFFATTLIVGLLVAKKSGKSSSEYFLSGRNMPWWLLGISMVATTFSTDTPNLVTDIVRNQGVSGNWVWWAFLITGLLTVFVYAKLWRKSEVNTDIEFYELRYGGKPAKFLRGFRAVYLGVIFNIMAMSAVTLAAIKIGQIMLGLTPLETIGYAGLVTVIFSTIGGFKGVVYTDFILFFAAMAGGIGAAYYCVNLPEVGGMEGLMANEAVINKINILPDLDDSTILITLLIIPLAVQWWSAWYPGAEPGGGGYIAQRMLAAKDENHAIGATFFFNALHYALRPWPWILVALASIVVYPDIASIHEAFPNIVESKLGDDLAYSAMLTKLPSGLLGLVMASLIAAYMSTISTHLNWGSSYVVNDFYARYVKPGASQKEMVNVGRISTVLLMVISSGVALLLTNAYQLFNIILMFGAGTGLIFILRWFWWRINAWSEISAMFSSGIISILFNFTSLGVVLFGTAEVDGLLPNWSTYPVVVLLTSIVWISVTYLTKPEKDKTLFNFYKQTQPGGPGWEKIIVRARAEGQALMESNQKWSVPAGILATLVGCITIYGALFSTGYWIYGYYTQASILTLLTLIATIALVKLWQRIKTRVF